MPIYVPQEKYIEKVFERFGIQRSKPINTPLVAYFKLSTMSSPQTEDEVKKISHIPNASYVH